MASVIAAKVGLGFCWDRDHLGIGAIGVAGIDGAGAGRCANGR